MNIKKITSIGLCALTLSTSVSLSASAARSANPNNSQIVSKVEQFNKSRLKILDYYIWQININNCITEDLIVLYSRLDKLIVPNINIANSLVAPFNIHNLYSIGSQFDILFGYLGMFNINPLVAEAGARSTIIILNSKIDQIEAINE